MKKPETKAAKSSLDRKEIGQKYGATVTAESLAESEAKIKVRGLLNRIPPSRRHLWANRRRKLVLTPDFVNRALQRPTPNWAWWRPRMSLKDVQDRPMLCLRDMCSKFGRSGDVVQAKSIELKRSIQWLRGWGRSTCGTEYIRELTVQIFDYARTPLWWKGSSKAAVRHDADEGQSEYKVSPSLKRHNSANYTPTT